MSISVVFSREEVAAMKEGKAKPDVELTRMTHAAMAANNAAPEDFRRVAERVMRANPDVARLWVESNGVLA